MARFSTRTAWNLQPDDLAVALAEARAAGHEIVDLAVSNPTLCGFDYGPDLLTPLLDGRALVYDPDPRGLRTAREAVAAYYADHAAAATPEDLVLTTSTSEAYSFLFRLLADPGDSVLVAQPGYPLFDFLATLDHIRLEPYTLFHDHGWWVDFDTLERQVTPGTRALVVVHPANPTGHTTGPAERARLEAFCVRHGLALIVDEVFLDYGLAGPIRSFACGPHPCLTFVVSGLSKIAALPQMKCGWIATFGPGREEALARLEVIADTFLSMNAPVQLALPVWLRGRGKLAAQILDRVRGNLEAIGRAGLQHLPVEAGWNAILRLPQVFPAVTAAAWLLREAGVVVHPGSFYALPGEQYVVVSLLPEQRAFEGGMQRIACALPK